jgi:sulfur carrier protein
VSAIVPAAPATVRVTVNGELRELPVGTTVAALLPIVGFAAGRCAVEINRQIVPRSTHDSHRLADGDTIELVGFVGGG